mmetsp:Transcript_63606/g.196981  ORF Transcript_63606/g.196981 Transcript_63606/m.196981 type:complete len:258 (-) Transcript_63606:337-1110(-)
MPLVLRSKKAFFGAIASAQPPCAFEIKCSTACVSVRTIPAGASLARRAINCSRETSMIGTCGMVRAAEAKVTVSSSSTSDALSLSSGGRSKDKLRADASADSMSSSLCCQCCCCCCSSDDSSSDSSPDVEDEHSLIIDGRVPREGLAAGNDAKTLPALAEWASHWKTGRSEERVRTDAGAGVLRGKLAATARVVRTSSALAPSFARPLSVSWSSFIVTRSPLRLVPSGSTVSRTLSAFMHVRYGSLGLLWLCLHPRK